MARMNLLIALIFLSRITSGQTETVNQNETLSLTGVISMPDVAGRIDHLAYNEKQGIVYVAALGNNSVEVVDLKSGSVVHSIKGLDEPQGIRFIPETGSIVVANGGNGELKVFDAKSYQQVNSVNLGRDADNVRYDPSKKAIYVGYGGGAIAVVDAVTLKLISRIDLPAHPESFQPDGNGRIFVNLPDAHLLDVIDVKQHRIINKWEIREAASNFPMALDKINNRLFIGCRNPAKLLILDSSTGKVITTLESDGDTDDIFYDNASHEIYMSCGSGYVDIFRQAGKDNYEFVRKIQTGPGARTSLFIPELDGLLVAVPARSGIGARLLVYSKK